MQPSAKRPVHVAAMLGCLVLTAVSCRGGEGEAERWRGVFEPRAEAVIPAETSMLVVAMPRSPGESCRAGDLLVEFDAALPEAAVAAALAKAEAVELNLSGMRSLFEKNQVTAVELARAESEAAQVQLELAAARREARVCRVVAPFAGKIVERKVREHEWANRGSPLLLLVDDAVLRVRFFLPEENFSAIALGDTVAVWVPAVSRKVAGVVSRLGVVFDPVSRTFDVWAEVDNTDDSLRAGMTAEVRWPVVEDGG
ncbi:MAG: efflux RND transporter periplasmic adaptor subunit [Planctomycetes bacterium]|nr:efflux RND transporter periplasmic adaptor subunit [Planctomycetota bacterium]